MYKEIQLQPGMSEAHGIYRVADHTFIPFDPANTDYQAYLKWLDAGNTPEPADQPESTNA